MATTILLVRHGQTEWNRVERFRGRADVPLNAIYSSPLSRAVRTAEAIGRYVGLPVEIHPGLADIDYGEWQGLTPDEARDRWPEPIDLWYNSPQLAYIPGGETLDALRTRTMKSMNELAVRHAGQTIVLVGHTVINRIILLGVLGLGNERFWHIRQEPCAINIFEAEA